MSKFVMVGDKHGTDIAINMSKVIRVERTASGCAFFTLVDMETVDSVIDFYRFFSELTHSTSSVIDFGDN